MSTSAQSTPPWLAVVAVTPGDRRGLVEVLATLAPVRDRAAVGRALAHAVRSRTARLQAQIEQLRAERAALADDGTTEDERRFLEQLAQWCDELPHVLVAAREDREQALDEVSRCAVRAREADRALDDVLGQQAVADAALEDARIELEARADTHQTESDVRTELEHVAHALASTVDDERPALEHRLAVLERRLAVRAGGPDPDREAAVRALADQAALLEQRLREAVEQARTVSHEARRALSRAEAEVERLDNDARQRASKLDEAAAELDDAPVADRVAEPATGRELAERAARIGAGLRERAARLDEQEPPEAPAGDLEGLERGIREIEARCGVLEPGDLVVAAADLLGSPDGVVVLDEPANASEHAALLDAIRDARGSTFVVLLTAEPVVQNWASSLGEAERLDCSTDDVIDLVAVRTAGGTTPEPAESGSRPLAPTSTAATDAPTIPMEALRRFRPDPESRRDDR